MQFVWLNDKLNQRWRTKDHFKCFRWNNFHGFCYSCQIVALLNRFLVSTFSILGHQITVAYVNLSNSILLYSHKTTLGFIPVSRVTPRYFTEQAYANFLSHLQEIYEFILICINQYLNLKLNDYIRQNIVQSILNSKLWNIYYLRCYL